MTTRATRPRRGWWQEIVKVFFAPTSTCRRSMTAFGCGHAIRARHNVPVVGWLVLRGGVVRRYLSLALVAPGAMVFGEVKLSGVVGGVLAYLSWAGYLHSA